MAAKTPRPGRPPELKDPVTMHVTVPKLLKRKLAAKIARLRKTDPKVSISSAIRDALEAYVAAEPGEA